MFGIVRNSCRKPTPDLGVSSSEIHRRFLQDMDSRATVTPNSVRYSALFGREASSESFSYKTPFPAAKRGR